MSGRRLRRALCALMLGCAAVQARGVQADATPGAVVQHDVAQLIDELIAARARASWSDAHAPGTLEQLSALLAQGERLQRAGRDAEAVVPLLEALESPRF